MKTTLFLKTATEHRDKLKKAKAHKRLFKGLCGGMSFKSLAVQLQAGKPQPQKATKKARSRKATK